MTRCLPYVALDGYRDEQALIILSHKNSLSLVNHFDRFIFFSSLDLWSLKGIRNSYCCAQLRHAVAGHQY